MDNKFESVPVAPILSLLAGLPRRDEAPPAGAGERIVSGVTYCVPAMGGSLTTERGRAGWRVGLNCARQCEFNVSRNLHYAGVTHVDHECASPDEVLLTPDGPLPTLLRAEPKGA